MNVSCVYCQHGIVRERHNTKCSKKLTPVYGKTSSSKVVCVGFTPRTHTLPMFIVEESDNDIYVVSYSWYEEHSPTVVYGPYQKDWQKFCRSLLPEAVQRAFKKAQSMRGNIRKLSWIGYDEIKEELLDCVLDRGYRVLIPHNYGLWGSCIIRNDHGEKHSTFKQPDRELICAYNDLVECGLDRNRRKGLKRMGLIIEGPHPFKCGAICTDRPAASKDGKKPRLRRHKWFLGVVWAKNKRHARELIKLVDRYEIAAKHDDNRPADEGMIGLEITRCDIYNKVIDLIKYRR